MIHLPPSKSIASRFLVASYFAGTLPADPLFDDNEDLMLIQQALLEIFSDEEPIDFGDSQIDVGASGTALRFVTAVCASCPGADYIVTGSNRLMQRPMMPLIEILREASAVIDCLGEKNKGPYRIKGTKIRGGNFSIRGDISSQFISALMLVGPAWKNGLVLNFTTPLLSYPYVKMTANVLQKFNVDVELSDTQVIIPHSKYTVPENFSIESDWSSASFFFEACALGATGINIAYLTSPEISLQGDSEAADLFSKLGVKSVFNENGAQLIRINDKGTNKLILDFGNVPDLVIPFALAALCQNRHFKIFNIAHLRFKESDRISALSNEAKKLGFNLKTGDDFIEWDGETLQADPHPVIDPHNDHRIAMGFAMCALKFGKISIAHPQVVEKSFISFWNEISNIGFVCSMNEDMATVSCHQG